MESISFCFLGGVMIILIKLVKNEFNENGPMMWTHDNIHIKRIQLHSKIVFQMIFDKNKKRT